MSDHWPWALLTFFPVSWWAQNRYYGRIWGRRLRTRYAWASNGALLWAKRLPSWERP